MNRRTFLAAVPGALAAFDASAAPARGPMGLVIHSFAVRTKKALPPDFPPVSEPIDFLAEAARLGAAGIQTKLPTKEADVRAVREAAEKRGLYVEGIIGLPKTDADVERFDAELKASKAAGAGIVRTVCMSGRRYEEFTSLEQFQKFAAEAWLALRRAEPIAARHKVMLAVENHKDWRIDEMVGWLKRLSSEWVRVCLDTGNSVALLEDPLTVAEAYAPFTVTTHLKDMGVSETDDGFLLAEVPFGDGFVNVPKIVALLRKTNPKVRLNLEMITRDPLRVPCLTAKYWATMPNVPARELADALACVRKNKSTRLPTISGLDHPGQLAVEVKNNERCLAYAAKNL